MSFPAQRFTVSHPPAESGSPGARKTGRRRFGYVSDSESLAERGMLRQPHAVVEKRAFRPAGRDPRLGPQPSAAVTLQARFA
jgi:hypothetical protein